MFIAAQAEPLLPPESQHPQDAGLAVDARLDSPDEAVAVQDRKHVVAPAPLRFRDVDLPQVVEPEEVAQQPPVPHERIQRCDEGHLWRHAAGRLAGGQLALGLIEEPLVFSGDMPHLSPTCDLHRHELALREKALALWRTVDRPWSGTKPDLARARRSEQAVSAVPRQQLVPALLV